MAKPLQWDECIAKKWGIKEILGKLVYLATKILSNMEAATLWKTLTWLNCYSGMSAVLKSGGKKKFLGSVY